MLPSIRVPTALSLFEPVRQLDAVLRVARNDVPGAGPRASDRHVGRAEELDADAVARGMRAVGSPDVTSLDQIARAPGQLDSCARTADNGDVFDRERSAGVVQDRVRRTEGRPIDHDRRRWRRTILRRAVNDDGVGDRRQR